MKLVFSAIVLCQILIVLGALHSASANQFPTFGFSNSTKYESCIDYMHNGTSCFQYEQPLKLSPNQTAGLNWSMDIIAPNNTCNIKGTIIGSTGGCTYSSIVLTQADFDLLKQNPSVLAVVRIQQSGMPSQDYCPVALWTWASQDDSFKAKYNETLVVPQKCLNPVPEFPTAEVAMIIAFITSCVLVMRYK